jgi:hypothetical protein
MNKETIGKVSLGLFAVVAIFLAVSDTGITSGYVRLHGVELLLIVGDFLFLWVIIVLFGFGMRIVGLLTATKLDFRLVNDCLEIHRSDETVFIGPFSVLDQRKFRFSLELDFIEVKAGRRSYYVPNEVFNGEGLVIGSLQLHGLLRQHGSSRQEGSDV